MIPRSRSTDSSLERATVAGGAVVWVTGLSTDIFWQARARSATGFDWNSRAGRRKALRMCRERSPKTGAGPHGRFVDARSVFGVRQSPGAFPERVSSLPRLQDRGDD